MALLMLVFVPLVAAALWHSAKRQAAVDRVIGGTPALRFGRSRWRIWLHSVLVLVAITLLAFAAARPQWGEQQRTVVQHGIDVAIALDVSRSMTATDADPNRASAAAKAIADLLASMSGDRGALVTFADSALVRSPLTRDLNALTQIVARAQAESALMRPGSNLGVALQRALGVLDIENPARAQVIVIVSDGEDPSDRRLVDFAVTTAIDRGVRVYAAVAGTAAGGDLPGSTLSNGGMEVSIADPSLLADIAVDTGGELRSLVSLPGLAVTFRRLQQSPVGEAEGLIPVERFQWFAGAALALLAVHTLVAEGGRHGRLGRMPQSGLSTSILLSVFGSLLIAACGGSDSYRETRAGNVAYAAGRYEEALAHYNVAAGSALPSADLATIAYDRGNALHRLERHEDATEASAQAMNQAVTPSLAADAAYALGSHAFRVGRFEVARDAFVTVLLRDPSDDSARANLEIVLRRLAPGPAPAPDESTLAVDANAAPNGTNAGVRLAGGNPAATPTSLQTQANGVTGMDVLGGRWAPVDSESSGVQSVEETRAALEAALGDLQSGEIPLGEALRILDLMRQLDTLAVLGQAPRHGRPLPPR